MSEVLYKRFINSVSTSGYKSGKCIPVHVMTAYRGRGGNVALICNLSNRWKWADSHPGHFCTPKESPVPTEYETSQTTQCLMTHFGMKQWWHN